MRRLVILVLLCVPVWPAFAEEKAGTTCDLVALVDPDDAGLLVAYDGLRKGLEIARLPRVCQHVPSEATGGVTGFLERQAMAAAPLREAGKRIDPIFVIGDASCAAVEAAGTRLPIVMAVHRYTTQRKPLIPLPSVRHRTAVYTDVPVERVASLVRSMLVPEAAAGTRARWNTVWVSSHEGTRPHYLDAFLRAWDGSLLFNQDREQGVQPADLRKAQPGPWAALLIQVDPLESPPDFQNALRFSRTARVPLVSDNRAHFGLGAVVVIVPRHDLLGKAAADEGRKLRADPTYEPTTRVVPGFEVWVDLAAADAIGFDLPLAFLARADRIKRGRPQPRTTKGVTR